MNINNGSPEIYFSYEKLLNSILLKHSKIEKATRVIILEQQVYPAIRKAMIEILNISFNKKKLTEEEIINSFNGLFYDTYLTQSSFSYLLNNRYINDVFYKNLTADLISCQKQLKSWQGYILGKKEKEKIKPKEQV